ncbi:hypothetical protein P7K49_028074, partial [Saguinus oedipus]
MGDLSCAQSIVLPMTIQVAYDASNSELACTKTLVKNCIGLINSTPYHSKNTRALRNTGEHMIRCCSDLSGDTNYSNWEKACWAMPMKVTTAAEEHTDATYKA